MRSPSRTPLEIRWDANCPAPVRAVRGRGAPSAFPGQPWHDTGPHGEPLDFSARVAALVADVALRCPEWAHVQADRVLFGFTQAQNSRLDGLQARVTPLRFPGGALARRIHGGSYRIQRFFRDEREYLYLMTFCLPRFLDQDFDSKLVTLFHELNHIGPAFDGDLRRHAGRYHLHSHSKQAYDVHATEAARAYQRTKPNSALTSFLRLNYGQLVKRHGQVVGLAPPRPKLIPLAALPAESAARSSGQG